MKIQYPNIDVAVVTKLPTVAVRNLPVGSTFLYHVNLSHANDIVASGYKAYVVIAMSYTLGDTSVYNKGLGAGGVPVMQLNTCAISIMEPTQKVISLASSVVVDTIQRGISGERIALGYVHTGDTFYSSSVAVGYGVTPQHSNYAVVNMRDEYAGDNIRVLCLASFRMYTASIALAVNRQNIVINLDFPTIAAVRPVPVVLPSNRITSVSGHASKYEHAPLVVANLPTAEPIRLTDSVPMVLDFLGVLGQAIDNFSVLESHDQELICRLVRMTALGDVSRVTGKQRERLFVIGAQCLAGRKSSTAFLMAYRHYKTPVSDGNESA